MSGASALYFPPDPNTAPGTHELGNEKSAFKIFGEKISPKRIAAQALTGS